MYLYDWYRLVMVGPTSLQLLLTIPTFYLVSKSGERVSTRTAGDLQGLADIIWYMCNGV